MKVISPNQVARSGVYRPFALLVTLTLAGWLAAAAWPQLLALIGIYDYGTTYLDSYSLLAAFDAMRAGADPHAVNALDPLLRYHVYSDWWLGFRWLGLTRSQNFMVGTAWVGTFALVAWTTVRPRNWRESLFIAGLLISPPFLLAINRANSDLVIFVLLAVVSVTASASSWWRTFVAIGGLVLATGLKYYPAPAALAFLWVRPVRRIPAAFLVGLVATSLALASVWTQIDRGRFTIGMGVHTMGAPIWWRDFGWSDTASVIPGFLLLVVAAMVLTWCKITVGLATGGEPAERMRAAIGAIVLLTCFAVGVNYSYRWIFILWPAIWLWRQANDGSLQTRQRWVARIGCTLVGLCLWLDGILCAVVNLLPPRDPIWVNQVQLIYRQWTQPLHWLLMILLAGWLLEAATATVRQWRRG